MVVVETKQLVHELVRLTHELEHRPPRLSDPLHAALQTKFREAADAGIEIDYDALGALVEESKRACPVCNPPAPGPEQIMDDLQSQLRDLDWKDDQRDARKAYVMAALCELSYRPSKFDLVDRYDYIPSETLVQLLAGGQPLSWPELPLAVQFVQTPTLTFMITEVGGTALISVRGTLWFMMSDWAINLNTRQTRLGFHSGFHEEAQEGFIALSNAMAMRGEAKRTCFTGHSMGAAVAAILTRSWRGALTPYLFACPRLGNEEAQAECFQFPYVKQHDLVPNLPSLSLGYADPAGIICVDENDPTSSQRPHLEVPAIADHAIERYRRDLGLGIKLDYGSNTLIDALKARNPTPAS
jgi:hypothetical protein